MKYVAFLRGINVGGSRMIKMVDLKAAFENLKFQNVQSLLATGNIIFESINANSVVLEDQIEAHLEKTFGYHIDTLVRSQNQIKSLVLANPFETVNITPQTRLYITFLKHPPQNDTRITSGAVCSTLTLSNNKNTTDLMKLLEKEFGKQITTRNWNTVLKINKILLS